MNSKDKTFTNFTPEQAAQYATNRGDAYPKQIYEAIIEYHQGEQKTALDVGTGPGKVVWDLVKYFDYVVGCDAGVQMIEQAKKDAAKLGFADKTSFTAVPAEDCAAALTEAKLEQADLITVGTAVHWFDMPAFYAAAAKALRPGGTLAMWTSSSMYCHPSTPHPEKIQALLSDLEDKMLRPYMEKGNLMARNAYQDLEMPWTSEGTAPLFDQKSFERREWDRDGVPSSPPLADGSPGPFLFGNEFSPEQAERMLSSASPVVRWREANPDKAGTEEDVLKVMIRQLQGVLGKDSKTIFAPGWALLLMRRA